MRIHVNDSPVQCAENISLLALLGQLNLLQPGTAIALNQTIVPREKWENHLLHDGDHILLFQAIAGG